MKNHSPWKQVKIINQKHYPNSLLPLGKRSKNNKKVAKINQRFCKALVISEWGASNFTLLHCFPCKHSSTTDSSCWGVVVKCFWFPPLKLLIINLLHRGSSTFLLWGLRPCTMISLLLSLPQPSLETFQSSFKLGISFF